MELRLLLTIILVFFQSFSLIAQEDSCSSIEFEKVIKVNDSAESGELYERARLWFANTYKDSKKVLEITDKENGELVGKGAIPYSSKIFMGSAGTIGWIHYTIRVSVKDGRYKYLLSNFYHEANPLNKGSFSMGTISKGFCPITGLGMFNPSKKWQKKVLKEMTVMSEERATLIIGSLIKSMNDKAKDDW